MGRSSKYSMASLGVGVIIARCALFADSLLISLFLLLALFWAVEADCSFAPGKPLQEPLDVRSVAVKAAGCWKVCL